MQNINIYQKKNIEDLVYIDEIYYFFDFKNKLISDLIHILKYEYAYDVSRFISKISYKKFYELYLNLKKESDIDFIFVPIPLNKNRYNERGFNQSELILKKIVQEIDLNFSNNLKLKIINLLKRIKYTKQQAKLSFEQRGSNLKNSFILDEKYIDFLNSFNIIIFDDVVTTGNTFEECSKVLRNFGFKNKIIGVAIAG